MSLFDEGDSWFDAEHRFELDDYVAPPPDEATDPATFEYEGLWIPPYVGSPWEGETSAGGSAGRALRGYSELADYVAGDYSVTADAGTWVATRGGNLTVGSNAPVANAGSPTFTATKSALYGAIFSGDWYGGANHIAVTVELSSITNAAAAPKDRQTLVAETDGNAGLHLHRTGAGPYSYWLTNYNNDSVLGVRTATVDITSAVNASGAGNLLCEGKKEGGFLYVRVNGSAWQLGQSCGTSIGTGSFLVLGANYNSTVFLEGIVRGFVITKDSLSGEAEVGTGANGLASAEYVGDNAFKADDAVTDYVPLSSVTLTVALVVKAAGGTPDAVLLGDGDGNLYVEFGDSVGDGSGAPFVKIWVFDGGGTPGFRYAQAEVADGWSTDAFHYVVAQLYDNHVRVRIDNNDWVIGDRLDAGLGTNNGLVFGFGAFVGGDFEGEQLFTAISRVALSDEDLAGQALFLQDLLGEDFGFEGGGEVAVAGTAAGAATTAAAATVARAAAATAAGAATTAANVVVARSAQADAAGAATTAANATVLVGLAAAAAGAATTTAAAAVAIAGAATAAGTSSADAAATADRALAATAAGEATASVAAAMERPLAGSSAGTSTASATAGRDRAIAATAAGEATTAAAASVERAASGDATGASTATANAVVERSGAGASAGSSTAEATAEIARLVAIAGASDGSATAVATAVVTLGAAASSGGVAASEAAAVVTRGLAASAQGATEGVASAAVDRGASATSSSGSSTTTAATAIARSGGGTSEGGATATAAGIVTHAIIALELELAPASSARLKLDAAASGVHTLAAVASLAFTIAAVESDLELLVVEDLELELALQRVA